MTTALETAMAWRNLGIATIPIRAGSKKPALHWREFQGRLPTEREIETWWGRPGYGLAVLTGWRGLAVIDFDNMAVYDLWSRLDGGRELAETYTVRTAKGMHLYVYTDCDTHNASGPGFDIRGGGGYVLAPPSVHPSGCVYQAVGGNMGGIVKVRSVWDYLPQPPPLQQAADLSGGGPTGTSIDEIKAKWTVWRVLGLGSPSGRYPVSIKCPLHGDSNPSFVIYPDGHFYCYGCHAHGDCIDLYALLHKIDNKTAMMRMADL